MKSNHRLPRPHIFVIWTTLFLFTCLPFSTAQPPKHIEVSPFPFQESFQISLSGSRFYRLDLSNSPEDVDLLVSVLPVSGSSSPKLFISNNKEFPQKMNDADYSSISTSGNVVMISNYDLKLIPKFLYIGLICGNDLCDAKISVESTKEIRKAVNRERIVEDFGETKSAVVRLIIPSERDVERIVVHLDARIPLKKEWPSLEVFINQGMNIPYTNKADSIPTRSPWFASNPIVIDRESSLFCVDCVITLNLKFSESSSIGIQAQTKTKNREISRNTELDGVLRGRENSYLFRGEKTAREEDLILSVKVFQGKVNVYVTCDSQPFSAFNYYWKFEVEDSREIILSPKTRSRCYHEDYFILVFGEPSVYSLSAAYSQSNQFFMGHMRETAPMTGHISSQGKIIYEVFVPIFSAEEIVMDFHSSEPLDINITPCRFPSDCPGLLPSKIKHQITNYYSFDGPSSVEKFNYKSQEIPAGGLRFTINPRESGCSPLIIRHEASKGEALPVCAYLVTISNIQYYGIGYSLATEFKGPNFLPIGEPKFDIVTKDKSVYYALYIPKSENVESVQIQLTKFSGDPDIFVSKTNKFPNKEKGDSSIVKFSHEGLIVLEVLPDPSGAYYIGVHGQETSSSFSLSAIIDTKSGKVEDSVFTLASGKPQKGVLLPKYEYQEQYYKILLNQDEDWKGTLRITVNSLRGRVLIVANNNGEFPTTEKNTWKDKDNDLEISSSDPNFKAKGAYYIGIIFDPSTPDANLLSDMIYHITYSLIDNLPEPAHTLLSSNTPFYGSIKKGESHYFEALLLVGQSRVTIYKYSDSGEIDVFISMDPNNKYPNQEFNTLTTKDQSIPLNPSDICQNSIACPIYITVVSSGGHKEVSYSLSMRYDSSTQGSSSPIALVDGRQIQSITPRNDQPAVFYYHAVPSQNSVVTVTCPGREVVIYAKRIKVNIKSLDEAEIEALDKKTAEFISEESDNKKGVNFIAIPPLADSEVTIVAVSVYFKETEKQETTFTILASSQIAQLSTRTPYSGFVAKDHYVYFVVNILRAECTLLISLTNLEEGDADLVISYGANTRPTIADHKFAYLSDQKTEIIEINNADISPLKSMTGAWIIGVYGDTSSSFSLSVVYEDRKMVDMKAGTSVEMSLEESSFVYFKYLHEFETNLQINFVQFSGELNLYMTSIDMNQDFVTNIPDQTHHKWKISGPKSPQSAITIFAQDAKACVSCVYIMNIEAVYSSKFSLVINESDNIIPIQKEIKYEGRLKPERYAIYMMKTSNEIQENQLNIEMERGELVVLGSHSSKISVENYIWKETITLKDPKQAIPLKKLATQKDSFYILFNNPTKEDVEFSFMLTPKMNILERLEQVYDLNPSEKKFFEYSFVLERIPTNHLDIDIIFYAVEKKGEFRQGSMQSYLNQGRTIQGKSWSVETFEGPKQERIFTAGYPPQVISNKTHVIVRQKFVGEVPEKQGRYSFEIVNPWQFPVAFRIFIGKSVVDSLVLSQVNTQHETYISSENFEFNMEKPGNWYLWVYSPSAIMDLKVKDGDPETGMVTIPQGGSYLYKEAISTIGERLVSVRYNAKNFDREGKVIIFSSIFDEKKFSDYDIVKDNLKVKLSQRSIKWPYSRVTAEFPPVELKDVDSSDEVLYQARLCGIDCHDAEVRVPAKQKKMVTVNFEFHEDPATYSLNIKATIFHKNQPIKFIHPYAASHIYVAYVDGEYEADLATAKRIFWSIVIGITLLVVLVSFIGFKKLKSYQHNRGLELQDMEISNKGYNPLEDEGEISPEEIKKGEESQVKEENKC